MYQQTRNRKKQTVETPEVPTPEQEPVKEVEEEVLKTASIEAHVEVKKVVKQVKRQKCDKMTSQKSLRYTHELSRRSG